MLPLNYFLYIQILLFLFITPGSPRILIASYAIRYGMQKTVWSALGDIAANTVQMIIIVFGLGSLLFAFPQILLAMKWLGIIYLMYLAWELMQSHVKKISIEEIDYAFKLERYGVYGERIQHFQLFNAEYVSKVLDQYKKWLLKTRQDNNISISKPVTNQLPELTESQKREIILNGLRAAHQEYQDTQSIAPGRIYLYDFLDEHGIMPTDLKVKERVKALAEKRLLERQKAALTQVERALYDITVNGKPSKKVVLACKEISLERLFKEYKNVDQIINKIK